MEGFLARYSETQRHDSPQSRLQTIMLIASQALVICTALKAGFLGSVRFGSGLVVARLPDNTWSAPSAIALSGLGGGGQFGLELTDFVFVLDSDAAVAIVRGSGALAFDANISIAFGAGRSAEYGALVGTAGVASIYAYSKTRGVYGGATLEGGVFFERSAANAKMYGRRMKAVQLLSGEVPPPPEAEPLMRILNSEAFRLWFSPDEIAVSVSEAGASQEPERHQSTVLPAAEPRSEQRIEQ